MPDQLIDPFRGQAGARRVALIHDQAQPAGGTSLAATAKSYAQTAGVSDAISDTARDLGVVIDRELSLTAHVTAVCHSGYNQLRPVSYTHLTLPTIYSV